MIPRTDALYFLIVAGNQGFGALQHHIFVRAFACQLVGFAETIVHHETEVVSAFMPFGFFYQPSIADGLLPPEIIVCIGVYLP